MENFARLFAYDDWANREEVRRLIAAPNRAVQLLAHIIGTQWLWLARLRGETSKMAVWPALSLDDMPRELDGLKAAWREPRGGSITYRNSKGETWTSDVGDVLIHVILHGAYHRGQIATVVRGAGGEPAYTDYIHCTRIGAI